MIKKYSLLLLLLSSCIEHSDYSVPVVICEEPEFENTHTIQQIKETVGFGLKEFRDETIISGYVVTSDEYGNFYKSLYVQDKPENPTSAIKIELDLANYYTKFPFGRKIFIKLKGLSVANVNGVPTIGKAIGGGLERIPNILIKEHIFRSCETAFIKAKKTVVSEINDARIGMLLAFENVQLKTSNSELTFADVSDTKSVDIAFEQFSENCISYGELLLQTSGFSRFKSNVIPNKKGKLTAILDKYYGSFYLKINDTSNVQFETNRCESSDKIEATISIKDMCSLYDGEVVEFGLKDNLIIEGYVISSDEEKNIQNKIVIQDAIENPKGGIQLLIDKENYFQTYSFGEKVYIKLDRLYLDKVAGKFTLGVFKNDSVDEVEEEEILDFLVETDSIFKISPKELFIENSQDIDVQQIFSKLKNVQLTNLDYGRAFAYYSGKESAKRFVETCGINHKVAIVTNGEAVFANKQFPMGKGNVIGVFSKSDFGLEMELNSEKDISFLEEYEECPKFETYVMITEIADPENSVSSRFVELYNPGELSIDLSGWKLNKYINGSTTVSSNGIELQGIIKSKAFFVIANTGFSDVFGFSPDLESTYITGNGDDVYELMNMEGVRQDVYGEVGIDGTDEIWEYTDGRAERKLTVDKPTKHFDISEWNVFSKASSTSKNVPEDFNPLQRE